MEEKEGHTQSLTHLVFSKCYNIIKISSRLKKVSLVLVRLDGDVFALGRLVIFINHGRIQRTNSDYVTPHNECLVIGRTDPKKCSEIKILMK